ncbi:hypothetical protein B0H16DRAFT_1526974, partial [Mycena metata]
MGFLENVIPVLSLAKASVTSIGVPAVEPVINGVLELATMVSTMRSNKEDLAKLENCLNDLITLDASGCSEDLKNRLTALTSDLNSISLACKALVEKPRFNRFVMSRDYKDRIQEIKNSIGSCIRNFTFYGNISIEELIACMTVKVDEVLTKEILSNLKTVSARYNADNTPEVCMQGTRVNTITEIVTRLTGGPDESQRIIMLSGSAGSGKSTVAKTVASILA